MFLIKVFLVLSALYKIHNVVPITKWEKKVLCSEIPMNVLESILGAAFNPRYMSIDKPPASSQSSNGPKRGAATFEEDFAVDDTFLEQVDAEPAWKVTNHVALNKQKHGIGRGRRDVADQDRRSPTRKPNDYKEQWDCPSTVKWIDLGEDYFPRFLRSIACLAKNCWFNVYECRPRSFTVKILRRKKGFCATKKRDRHRKVGVVDMPEELKELWVWEERAVNFCCACTKV